MRLLRWQLGLPQQASMPRMHAHDGPLRAEAPSWAYAASAAADADLCSRDAPLGEASAVVGGCAGLRRRLAALLPLDGAFYAYMAAVVERRAHALDAHLGAAHSGVRVTARPAQSRSDRIGSDQIGSGVSALRASGLPLAALALAPRPAARPAEVVACYPPPRLEPSGSLRNGPPRLAWPSGRLH